MIRHPDSCTDILDEATAIIQGEGCGPSHRPACLRAGSNLPPAGRENLPELAMLTVNCHGLGMDQMDSSPQAQDMTLAAAARWKRHCGLLGVAQDFALPIIRAILAVRVVLWMLVLLLLILLLRPHTAAA